MSWPVSNPRQSINFPFGEPRDYDGDGIYDDRHEGVDIYARSGDVILAAMAGTVSWASDKKQSDGRPSPYGWHVKVNHEGDYYQTWYCHLAGLYVQAGDNVRAGDALGPAGSTGNSTGVHLHFNVRKRGHVAGAGYAPGDVVDPAPLLGVT